MAKLSLQYDVVPGGVELFLTETKRTLLLKQVTEKLDVDKWDVQDDLHSLSGLAKLAALVESAKSGPSNDPTVEVLPDGEGYFIPHPVIAELTEGQALSLGLPVATPFQLRIATTGPILEPETKINTKWYEAGRLVQATPIGALLDVGQTQYRIPEPLFTAINAIGAFNHADTSSIDARMEALAGMNALLLGAEFNHVHLEATLKDLRISHAAGFGLDLRSGVTGVEFDPLLFGQQVLKDAADTGEQITDAAHLLTAKQQEVFSKSLFQRHAHVKPSYVIEKGTYLYIDPSLRPALDIVREQQQADADSRKNFAKNPAGFIKQRLLGEHADDPELAETLEKLFVETTGFSERVLELGLWVPKAIPWLQRQPNTWLPEKLGIRLGDTTVEVSKEEIDPILALIESGIEQGETMVTLPDGRQIPANEDTRDAVQALRNELEPTGEEAFEPEPSPNVNEHDQDVIKGQKHVLVVQENIEEIGYLRSFSNRSDYSSPEVPVLLKNLPKPHQVEGMGWLQECWAKGFPGALLADDMGLGKTFQTLGFVSWLQRKRQTLGLAKQPALIVAPTSLLNNWLDEESMHLGDPGLGTSGLLFGSTLKQFKEKGSSNDIAEGRSTLRIQELMSCDWLLTTYETLRDYQISLGMLRLSCVVFDEIQKVKNPSSLNTNASKSLNADFTLGLTGTPVENSLADLWCICDTLIPGFLGDLKSFIKKYPEDDQEQLTALRAMLLERVESTPQPILRRMKVDILSDLPAKREHVLDEVMQGYQAECYSDLIKRVKREEESKGLQLLHKIRGLSLHPYAPDSDESNDADRYIADSARMRVVFKQLDRIAAINEKTLIFVESIAMQEWLAFVIKQRYGLKHLPSRIYGEIPATERKRLVDRFQERRDIFGVMILSPKAGGVGLTITAATHVIHLSRWWNPAVEDQCTDRAYRIGQDREVNVYIPRAIHPVYGDGSFDVILHDLLQRKRELSRTMLIPMESKRDLDFLFSHIGGSLRS